MNAANKGVCFCQRSMSGDLNRLWAAAHRKKNEEEYLNGGIEGMRTEVTKRQKPKRNEPRNWQNFENRCKRKHGKERRHTSQMMSYPEHDTNAYNCLMQTCLCKLVNKTKDAGVCTKPRWIWNAPHKLCNALKAHSTKVKWFLEHNYSHKQLRICTLRLHATTEKRGKSKVQNVCQPSYACKCKLALL